MLLGRAGWRCVRLLSSATTGRPAVFCPQANRSHATSGHQWRVTIPKLRVAKATDADVSAVAPQREKYARQLTSAEARMGSKQQALAIDR